jgi:hypothetical protein
MLPGARARPTVHFKPLQGGFMSDKEQKSIPWEQQREILISANALKFPLLHQNLIETYGEKKGNEIFEEVFETSYKKDPSSLRGKTSAIL